MEDWERGFQIGGNRVANFQYLGMLPSADTVGTYLLMATSYEDI